MSEVVPIRPVTDDVLAEIREARIVVAEALKWHVVNQTLVNESQAQLTRAENNLKLATRRLLLSLNLEGVT